MESLLSFASRMFLPSPEPGDSREYPLELLAVPGLMTVLDVALYRSVEGQLTATTCSGHALLAAWLDVKHQSQLILKELSLLISAQAANTTTESVRQQRHLLAESFCRLCLEAACDVVERISTDKLAQSANLSDPYEQSSGIGHATTLSGVGQQGIANGVLESKAQYGRRYTSEQRPQDCWESARLFCPDYVWADDVWLTNQRILKQLNKHSFYQQSRDLDNQSTTLLVSGSTPQHQILSPNCERLLSMLLQLVQQDVPMRLYQFRAATEADSVVSKRLYLVKCEYRAPFRAFLEAHQSVQRAPTVDQVDAYLKMPENQLQQKRNESQHKLQQLLESSPGFVEALSLETAAEEHEINIARALFPFTELGRILDQKRCRLVAVPGIVEQAKVVELRELLRRLKHVLCRLAGPETSTGIRPLLLDIRGMPRDEDLLLTLSFTGKCINNIELDSASLERLEQLVHNLKLLGSLLPKSKQVFRGEKRNDVDFPAAVLRGCIEDFDAEMFQCHIQDFFAVVARQHEIMESHDIMEGLEAKIRAAEMETSLAAASTQSLSMIRSRLELIATDRRKRFQALEEMVEEVCLREMNLHVKLEEPANEKILLLQKTSGEGIFGRLLKDAKETLPIG